MSRCENCGLIVDEGRLKAEPGYWRCVAPEGATHFDPYGLPMAARECGHWWRQNPEDSRDWKVWDVDLGWVGLLAIDHFVARPEPANNETAETLARLFDKPLRKGGE